MDLVNKILYIFEFITIVYQIILGVVFENCAQNVNTARLFCHKNLSTQAREQNVCLQLCRNASHFFRNVRKSKKQEDTEPFFDFATHGSILQWGNMIFLE